MNINWLYQEISGAISNFMYTWFFTFIGIGVLGLIIGIVVVVALEYRKMFERPNSFWGFLAKLNYIYTPVCFAALFGLLGPSMAYRHRQIVG
jgi:heme/copper-type cytochrome/quinol oxidase subunit 2